MAVSRSTRPVLTLLRPRLESYSADWQTVQVSDHGPSQVKNNVAWTLTPPPLYWIDVPQDGEDGDADDDAERKMKRKSNRSEATLAKDFSSIKVKKLDLDFTVDPLFKKTSADFDEGGARGLLLNNLTVDRDCKIIFDASDAFADADDDEQTNSPKVDESQVKKEANEDETMQDAMDVEPAPEGTDNDKKTHEKIATDEDKVEVSRLKGTTWILITLLT